MAKDFRFERLKEYVDFLADSELSVEHLAVYQRSCAEVSESHFFILEMRMRVSMIQSRTSRRDREFLTLNLRL